MQNRKLLSRYNGALIEAARERGVVDRVERDLARVHARLGERPDLYLFFLDPRQAARRKHQVIDESLPAAVEGLTRNFLHLIVDHHREALLIDVFPHFRELSREQRSIEEAIFESARPLEEDHARRLVEAMARWTGRKIEPRMVDRPDLIAGVRIRVGHRVLDGSLRGRLRGLRGVLSRAHLGGGNDRAVSSGSE